MTELTFAGASSSPPASILVVDDDKRVLELLEVALTANGYRVLTAADGDEGVRRALSDRPDLVLLDVRLPRKSGLEVCELLRADAEDPFVPIILVSAAVETETRLQAFRRGADDYLAKPFSPKELIARIRRLLARAGEGATARRRARELDHELARVRDELRRAHAEVQHAERLRDVAYGLGREFHRCPDPDDLARRFLAAAESRAGIGPAVLLVAEAGGEAPTLEPAALPRAGPAALAGVTLDPGGDLVTLLAGLGRPALARELQRLPELAAELGPLAARGVTLLAPLRGPAGIEGVLAALERSDGGEPGAPELDLLRGLCDLAAVALQAARRHREQIDATVALLGARAPATPYAEEARALAARAARVALLPARLRRLLDHALALARWSATPAGADVLAGLEARDDSGRVAGLRRVLAGAGTLVFDAEAAPEERRAALLVALALAYEDARARGAGVGEALAAARASAGIALDATTAWALEEAVAPLGEAAALAADRPTS